MTILHEKRDVPVTTVMLAFKYGSAYEQEDEKGVAHFIEHMCFKGTKKRTTEQISSTIEKLGGDINAFTHEEVTAYHVKISSEHASVAMDVLFDMCFHPLFEEKEMQREISVIGEEIKMHKDDPTRHSLGKIKENLFEKPFGIGTIGSVRNLQKLSRVGILEKHKQIYCPKNTILCVVGNNELKDIEKLVNQFSKDISSNNFIEQKRTKVTNIYVNSEEERKNLEQSTIILGFHFPFAASEGRYAAELFSTILGSGMSSRLWLEVREKRGLAYSVKTFLDAGTNYGYLVIYVGVQKGKEKEAREICLKEFKKMKNITSEELQKTKEQLIGQRKLSMEGSEDVALNLVLEEIWKEGEEYYNYFERINKVSLEQVRQLSKISKNSSFSLLSKQ